MGVWFGVWLCSSVSFFLHQICDPSPPVSPSEPVSPTPASSEGETGGGRGWEVVREEEGKVEGATTANLRLLHVEKEQEGQYRCRVEYKGCTVLSESASLTVLEDGNFTHSTVSVVQYMPQLSFSEY